MPPEPFFAGPGLDRADSLRARPEEIERLRAAPEARALCWADGAPVPGENGLEWRDVAGNEPLFLGFDGERRPCFSALPDDGDIPQTARNHWGLLGLIADSEAPLFAAALSLTNWHRRHGFCANCGSTTAPNRGGWSRQCGGCGTTHFPRVDPVVIMLAEHDGRLLLGRQPAYPPGRYSALAGFVEPGETIEAAVAREIKEEAGIAVARVRYVASQPWPFPSSLMIGAHATALTESLTIDRDELDDARWFTRAEVAAAMAGEEGAAFLAPPRFAIARTLLEHWLVDA